MEGFCAKNQLANQDPSAAEGQRQAADSSVLVAELGSLSLEFTRLSQISKDPRYFDAIQRITDQFDSQQETTKLPGMFPVVVNAKDLDLGSDSGYTLGAMADSFYEYLPKVDQSGTAHLSTSIQLTNPSLGIYASRRALAAVSQDI